jgi:E3 ubiquitin-protein ligase UBR4
MRHASKNFSLSKQLVNESLAIELSKIKLKYFTAWRKYTLKKRKHSQQQQTGTNTQSSLNLPSSKTQQMPQMPAQQSSEPESTTTTVKPQIVMPPSTLTPAQSEPVSSNTSLNNYYDYDLKSKWLKQCLFCTSSKSVRQLTCNIIQSIFLFYSNSMGNLQNQMSNDILEANSARKFQIAELLCQSLEECGNAGEYFGEYLNLLKLVINDKDCKYRLVLKCGILNKIETLLHREIKYLSDLERLSESTSSLSDKFSAVPVTLSTNLTLGYSVKCLAELLAIFLKENNIKNKFKGHLIATVLNSYLSLKKLVFQRIKLIEEAQEKLLNTLEQMTSGTEIETRKFMSICIDTVNNFDLDDLVTPVFIFERLCNIIYPEEVVDNKEFSLILEKDPNQEDYLQGRMLGNPYSSNEPGLGPLMRNVKNKICTDCELVALLEDDYGMELLVNNKIIALDLTVRDVYKKVWLAEVLSEHEPMRIVYRMTGLSGDATEDIIDNLDAKGNDSTKNEEEIYRMADELAHNGALPVMLERLSSITQQNFTFGKPLLSVLLKLFDYALKLSINRNEIIKPEMKAITTMLQTLNMMLKIEQAEPNKIGVHLAEQLLNIMELILSEASKQPADIYNEFSSLCGDTEQLEFLLNNINGTFVRSHPNLLQALMRLIPFLSFGDEKKMKSLISYFSTYYSNFEEFDKTIIVPNSTNQDMLHLECFCVIVNGIEIGEMGKRLRDMMRDGGVSQKSIEYLIKHSPKVTTYLNSDFELWKDFITRNSLPYVLRILTGLCRSHESIQDLIGESCIPLLHKLEQFSSGNLVGILAEDLLLALKQNPSSKVSAAIEEVRNQTKAEKKKLAMAMRQKQLNQLGMKTNEKGQLIATDPSTLKNITDEVGEEKGHICCICREGYKYHPQKVLAIYTFTKKVDLEPMYETKTRKTTGYSTVTHFNLVHIDCHTNAIRSARTCRDEWENAALQNANTKCNGILPIWGPDVTETLFSNALAR